MESPLREAIDSFTRWNNAFNSRNTEAQINEMHFPHLRLSGNRFQLWRNAEDFRVAQEQVTKKLKEEGWHHTSSLSINPIQVGLHKVHLAIRQSRQYADGTEYNGFDTLWIFTKINEQWGVQFRSSFLTNTNVSGYGSSELELFTDI